MYWHIAATEFATQKLPHIYIGQTKRKLKSRINEHKSALTNLDIKSNVAEHSFKTNHNINFNNTKIIYRETNHRARKFLEKMEYFK